MDTMKTREIFDIFGLNEKEIEILQRQYSDFPVKGTGGKFEANPQEMKIFIRNHPGVLTWSELHFRYDGRAV